MRKTTAGEHADGVPRRFLLAVDRGGLQGFHEITGWKPRLMGSQAGSLCHDRTQAGGSLGHAGATWWRSIVRDGLKVYPRSLYVKQYQIILAECS